MKICTLPICGWRLFAIFALSATSLLSACSFDSSLNGLECDPQEDPRPGIICQEGYWQPEPGSDLDIVTDARVPRDVEEDIHPADVAADVAADIEADIAPDVEDCPLPALRCGDECVDLTLDPRHNADGSCDTGALGLCATGAFECVNGVFECVPSQEPAAEESCGEDGTGTGDDENCNGVVDENCNDCADGATRSCYSGPPGTINEGVCVGGEQTCADGRWGSCGGTNTTPVPEICDGLDNNCDGTVDNEILGVGDPCSVGEGACENAGLIICDAGQAQTICDAVEKPRHTYYRDADNDGFGNASDSIQDCAPPAGYVENDRDCDDSDAAIHPGASERCDAEDHNCNGDPYDGFPTRGSTCTAGAGACENSGTQVCMADGSGVECDAVAEVPRPFWSDSDGDSFGDEGGSPTMDCAAPTGFVENQLDCNDARGDINPNADEICDNIDNDCNGTVDDAIATVGDSCTVGTSTCENTGQLYCDGANSAIVCDVEPKTKSDYYFDGDDDGYGDRDKSPKQRCAAVGRYTATVGGDCDDTNDQIHPAADEICDNIDNNCDENIDEGAAAALCPGVGGALICEVGVCCNDGGASSADSTLLCSGQPCAGDADCASGDCEGGVCD